LLDVDVDSRRPSASIATRRAASSSSTSVHASSSELTSASVGAVTWGYCARIRSSENPSGIPVRTAGSHFHTNPPSTSRVPNSTRCARNERGSRMLIAPRRSASSSRDTHGRGGLLRNLSISSRLRVATSTRFSSTNPSAGGPNPSRLTNQAKRSGIVAAAVRIWPPPIECPIMPIGASGAGANTRASSHKSIVDAFHIIPDDSRPESPCPRTSIATT
jgi:hypothetical protein